MIIRRMGCRIAEALSYLGVNCPSECSGVEKFCPDASVSVSEAKALKEERQRIQGEKQVKDFYKKVETALPWVHAHVQRG